MVGYLGLGPAIVDAMLMRGYSMAQAKVTGAVIAGVLSATLSHPADTIKTCMQVGCNVFALLWALAGHFFFLQMYCPSSLTLPSVLLLHRATLPVSGMVACRRP